MAPSHSKTNSSGAEGRGATSGGTTLGTATSGSGQPSAPQPPPRSWFAESRETVESFAVAIMLALLFRAFIAEAFVIPTGSMAPTLMGRHIDTTCTTCGLSYQATASAERARDDSRTSTKIVDTRCPSCGFRQDLNISDYLSNDHSFSGDRIIVSKFAYQFSEPRRWDVIVFKHTQDVASGPNNYIKRLIGLPGETVRIEGGNIYTRTRDDMPFAIARKPAKQLLSMLQVVHDSEHVAPPLVACGWPVRWQAAAGDSAWTIDPEGSVLTLASSGTETMARYHHVEPLEDQWEAINAGEGAGLVQSLQKDSWQGRLIVDSYAYNSSRGVDLDPKNPQARPLTPPRFREQTDPYGRHWVDDLALECTAEVKSTSGLLRCDLVRGGMYYVCRIDVASGQATLSQEGVNAQMGQFGEGAELYTSVVGSTSVRGPGTYRLRLTNVDHQLRLWVNDTEIAFNGPTVYASPALVMPDVSQPHRGDLAPAGVGGQNVQVAFRKLRILRDKYYTLDIETPDYDARKIPLEYQSYTPTEIARDALAFPNPVTLQALLPTRGFREIQLGADQFMPLGDNSPASSDARFWERKYVERRLLIGRAVCIYWPHSWWNPLGWPNFRRMQPIH